MDHLAQSRCPARTMPKCRSVIIEFEPGATTHQHPTNKCNEYLWNSSLPQIMQQAVSYGVWEGPFNVQEQDRGHLTPSPCSLYGVHEQMEGVGSRPTWTPAEVGSRDQLAHLCQVRYLLSHYGREQFGDRIEECHRPVCLRDVVSLLARLL